MPKRLTMALLVLGALILIAVPTTLFAFSQIFNDVPPGSQFYDDINAIAMAGITTGCGSGNYCPDDYVTRKAMAAFMHRGYSRVHLEDLGDAAIPASETTVWTGTITPGLPAGILSGAKGFIKADVNLTLGDYYTASQLATTCKVRGALYLDGTGYMSDRYSDVSLFTEAARQAQSMSMTGVAAVSSPGTKYVRVRLATFGGDCSNINAYGNLTLSYYPFGGTGENALSPSQLPGDSSPSRPK